MKIFFSSLLIVVLSSIAGAQAAAAKPANRTAIEGIVTKEPGSEAVKKAVIELIAENQAEGGDYTAVSGADGGFRIEGIIPGRYRLFAERTGLLEVDKHRARPEGRMLTLAPGQEVKDLRIRFEAAAVVRGCVTDEDGDPLPNAQVAVLRQTFTGGHSRWEQAGAERTNDLGEYRIAGLAAGNYYVSATPAPDFKSLIEGSNSAAKAEPGVTEDKPETSYQTTYYPGTADRGQAASIQLRAGNEFPVNFSLAPGPTLSIHGVVMNLPARSSAVIMLRSRDFNLIMSGAQVHADGSFVIADVAPGSYTIQATVDNSAVPMIARQTLQVASSSVEGLRLSPQPGGWIHGRLRVESKASSGKVIPSQFMLALHPADGDDDELSVSLGSSFTQIITVAGDGSFEWKAVPPGNYHVQLLSDQGPRSDWYLKSVLAGGRESDESGISVNGGTVVLDLVASANGVVVEGLAADKKGEPVANAVVVAVPEPRLRAQADRYGKTVSDQSGKFSLSGLPPGEYTLFAWESVDGEAYENPEFLKAYEGQGSALHMGEGERKAVQLVVIADSQDEPQ